MNKDQGKALAPTTHKPMVVAAMDDDDNRFEALFDR